MNILTINGFAFRIPESPSRYRGNCSKEWGCFVHGETKGMTNSKAEKAGLTKGDFVEMAICWIDHKILTFQPNYINENFTEIWGIPVAGEMKTQFPEKASELSTFLIHRQSKDKMQGLIEVFSRKAFTDWVSEGMKGDINEYAQQKANEYYFSNIFRFEMTQTEGSYGVYHYIQTSTRPPKTDLDKAAIEAAKQISQLQLDGVGYCTDSRIEDNHAKCQLLLNETESKKVITLPNNEKRKLNSAK